MIKVLVNKRPKEKILKKQGKNAQGYDGWKPADREGEPKAPSLLPSPQWKRGDDSEDDYDAGDDPSCFSISNSKSWIMMFCSGSSLLILSACPSILHLLHRVPGKNKIVIS